MVKSKDILIQGYLIALIIGFSTKYQDFSWQNFMRKKMLFVLSGDPCMYLAKNQHTQRKPLFEFITWQFFKSAKIWLSKLIFFVKNHPNLLLLFFSIQNNSWVHTFCKNNLLITWIYETFYFLKPCAIFDDRSVDEVSFEYFVDFLLNILIFSSYLAWYTKSKYFLAICS